MRQQRTESRRRWNSDVEIDEKEYTMTIQEIAARLQNEPYFFKNMEAFEQTFDYFKVEDLGSGLFRISAPGRIHVKVPLLGSKYDYVPIRGDTVRIFDSNKNIFVPEATK
jgi:hypothetical protein